MCHVLIVEDEWLIAEYIEQIARDAGATSIMTADCEADAAEAANSRTPEIILSDVNLRTGTGPCAVETILATFPDGDKSEDAVDGQGRCVLVVEDNIDVGRFSTQALDDFGYRTVWVSPRG